jgi:CHAT domain-containing protein
MAKSNEVDTQVRGQEGMFMKILILLICLGLFTISVTSYGALVPEADRLAGSARYAELEAYLEGQAKNNPNLSTKELFFLCGAYFNLKEYNKLFSCLDRLQTQIDQGGRLDITYDNRVAITFDISAEPAVLRAAAYIDFGNYAEALAQATKAYEIVQQRNLSPWMRIQALGVLALAKALQGERSQAEEDARLLGDMAAQNTGGFVLKTDILNAQARTYMALGDFQRSLAIIRQDEAGARERSSAKSATVKIGAIKAQDDMFAFSQLPKAFILNKSLYETGQVQKAKAGYDKLLANPQARDNGDIYWLILFDRGKIAEAEGNRQEAIDYYRRAIEVIERQRSTINTEASKIGFVGNKQLVYHALIAALVAGGQPTQAFEYVERSKSRALVDLLASKQDFAAPQADQQQVTSLVTELDTQEAQAWVQKAGVARNSRAFEVKQRLQTVAPELASLVTVAPVAVANIQSLLQSDEALVEYYYEGDYLYAFVVNREAVKGFKLNGDDLISDIRQFRAALEQPESQSYVIPAQKLYTRLITPLEALLIQKKLLIVAHGALHYLPFSALKTGNEYLIDRYSLRQLPSASVLQFLTRRPTSPVDSVLALGNPDLENPEHDLKFAQDEAETIAKDFPKAKVLVRKEATKTAFKSLGPQFSYIHFATHGRFDPDQPLLSGLLLAKEAQSNGFLSLGELYSLRLHAELVTLSACETGLGKIRNGDDVVGLTRGFLYAGSNTIVASLWEVDDQATSYLMQQFYADLKTHNKGEALRQAQLATRKKFNHPYYWAAFKLTGKI